MQRTLIFKNTLANFLGQVVSKGLRILLVPLQINILGEQAFGLLGFYAVIFGLVEFLDLGLGLTANREVARLSTATGSGAQEVRNLVRTFEIPYWVIGGLLGGMVLACAGWFSDRWITAPDLSRDTIVFSVTMIGLMLAFRWPVSLYRGILFGLQRQVDANLLGIGVEILNGVGSVLVTLVYRSVEAFFLWQLVASTAEISGYAWFCWRALRSHGLPRPYFLVSEIKRVWRFALGVNASALIGSVLGRADGLILSKLFPINFLGYYSLAQRTPPLIGMFPASLISATNPSLVAQYERRESSQMRCLYSRQTRWISFIGIGLAGALAAFSYPILLLWTQSENTANAAALPFAIISAATALDVMSCSVNQLTLACGFTGPSIAVASIAGLVVAAGTFILAPNFGICGAAIAYGTARVMVFVLYPLLVHRVVLRGYARTWFLSDSLPLFIVGGCCFGCAGLVYHFLVSTTNDILWIPIMAATGIIYVMIVLALDLIPDWRDLISLWPLRIYWSQAKNHMRAD